MANPIVEASGTKLATGAEDTLATIATPRNLVLLVDLSNMAAGDTVTLRVKRAAKPAGLTRSVYEEVFSGVQDVPIAISAPIPSPTSASFTLQQSAGTMRNFDWAVESL